MKIEVKNLGPIKKGTVDLDKKVTVFVGYNNSGKTYMSQLLWALNEDENLLLFEGAEYIPELTDNESIIITKETVSKLVNGYSKFISDKILPDLFNVKIDFFSSEKVSIIFPNLVDEFLERFSKDAFTHFSLYRKENEIQSLNTGYFSYRKTMDSLQISIETNAFSKPIKINAFDKELPEISSNHIANNFNDVVRFKKDTSVILLAYLFNRDFLDEGLVTFFLPANRVFYPSFYKYIYSIAKEEKDLIDDRLKKNGSLESIKALSKSPYTRATDALIEKVYKLNTNPEIKNHYTDLLSELKEIIGGDIIIKSAEGIAPIEFYLKLDNGKELEMYMSSSSANQLTTLYLYLKYWAEKENNFLIIDEPEENLHPENQIKLVNILMKFADRGNKILITTHSPLITDHINNYANLSYLEEKGTNTEQLIAEGNAGISAVKNIKHKDYGVYFFNGDSIKEYAINDYGAYFRDFQTAEDKVKSMSNILKDNIYKTIHPDA